MPNQSQDSQNVLITGASGLIGSAIGNALREAGYTVYALERSNKNAPFNIDISENRIELDAGIPLTAVINLAGANIAGGRWTEKRKQLLRDSRLQTTRLLCEALAQSQQKPELLLSASAIGFYGSQQTEPADENAEPGDDFLARLSVDWEKATEAAADADIRVVILRFGLVMSADGGMLDKLIMPLKAAVAGRIGDGSHLQSWISIRDVVSVMLRCMENREFSGPLNVVAPEVLSNKEFVRTLSQVLRRPLLPPVPVPVARLMFGEMADAALLASSNIRSSRMQELGMTPAFPNLKEALEAEFS